MAKPKFFFLFLFVYLFIFLFIYSFLYLFICLLIYLFIYLLLFFFLGGRDFQREKIWCHQIFSNYVSLVGKCYADYLFPKRWYLKLNTFENISYLLHGGVTLEEKQTFTKHLSAIEFILCCFNWLPCMIRARYDNVFINFYNNLKC